MSSYLNKQLDGILNESLDLIIPGIVELLSDIGMGKLLQNFSCNDKSSFDKIKNKIIELIKNKEITKAEKLKDFLLNKYDECLNKK